MYVYFVAFRIIHLVLSTVSDKDHGGEKGENDYDPAEPTEDDVRNLFY